MKLSPELKKWFLLGTSLFVGTFFAQIALHPDWIVSNLAASGLSDLESVKFDYSGSKIPGASTLLGGSSVADHLAGRCYKGSGDGGLIPGIVVPMVPGPQSCNSGIGTVGLIPVSIPIPDCSTPGVTCIVPTGCLNFTCAAFKNALYDQKSGKCGCAEPSASGVASSYFENLTGFKLPGLSDVGKFFGF
jgi:hypothetical protein